MVNFLGAPLSNITGTEGSPAAPPVPAAPPPQINFLGAPLSNIQPQYGSPAPPPVPQYVDRQAWLREELLRRQAVIQHAIQPLMQWQRIAEQRELQRQREMQEALSGIGVLQPATDPLTRAGRTGIDLARTRIPFAEQATDIAQRGIQQLPLAQGLRIGEVAGVLPEGAEEGTTRFLAEAVIPQEVWQAALEFIPGIGTVPDLMRAAKAGAPDAVRAVRQALDSPVGQQAMRVLRGERELLPQERELLAGIERNEGVGVRQGVEAFWKKGLGTVEAHRAGDTASIRLSGLDDQQLRYLLDPQTQRLNNFRTVYREKFGPGGPYVTVEVSGTEDDIVDGFEFIAQQLSPSPAQQAMRALREGEGGALKLPGTTSPPAPTFGELAQTMTDEQEALFRVIDVGAEQQGQAKNFGAVHDAIQRGMDPNATLTQRAKAVTQRVVSPFYYVRNANLLRESELGVANLAHSRKLAVGAEDAMNTAMVVGQRADLVRAAASQSEWAAKYKGPIPANDAQRRLVGSIADVVERPQLYDMTTEQSTFFKEYQDFLRSRLAYLQRNGVSIKEWQADYIEHLYDDPTTFLQRFLGGRKGGAAVRGSLGAKQVPQGARTRPTFWEAANEGLLPKFLTDNPNDSQRDTLEMFTRVHEAQTTKALADKQTAQELRKLGVAVQPGQSPPRGYRTVPEVPALAGYAFPERMVGNIQDVFGRGASPFEQLLLLPADIGKSMMLSLDGSPIYGIQGVRRVVDNPIKGLADVGQATQLIMHEPSWRAHYLNNYRSYRQAAADGVNLFKTFHVVSESQQASPLAKLPGIGKIINAAEERFYARGTALYKMRSYEEVKAQIEFGQRVGKYLPQKIRKALASGQTPGQIAAEHVNNIYGGLELAMRGQAPHYRAFERLMVLTPDFTRATLGLLGTAATKPLTPEGATALRFLVGAGLITAGVSELTTQAATGQHANLTDWNKSDWMEIKTPFGSIAPLGSLLTPVRSALRAGEKIAAGDFDRALGEAWWFASGREGIYPRGVTEQLTNRDFMGRPITEAPPFSARNIAERALYAAKSIAPLSFQQGSEGVERGGRAGYATAVLSAFGFSVQPVTAYEQVISRLEQKGIDPAAFFSEPGTRRDAILGDPQLGGLYRKWESERRSGTVEQRKAQKIVDDSRAAIEAKIAKIQGGEALPESLRGFTKEEAKARRTLRDALIGEKDSRDQELDPLYATYDQATDPGTGELDFEKALQLQEAILAERPELRERWERQQFVPVTDSPVELALKQGQKAVAAPREVGGYVYSYYGAGAPIWRGMMQENPELAQWPTYEQFAAMISRDALARGVDPDDELRKNTIAKEFSEYRTNARRQLLDAYPEVGAALRIWYGINIPKEGLSQQSIAEIDRLTTELYQSLGVSQ